MTLGTRVHASLIWLEETRVHCDNRKNKDSEAEQQDYFPEGGIGGLEPLQSLILSNFSCVCLFPLEKEK